jgi:hypothetical protein
MWPLHDASAEARETDRMGSEARARSPRPRSGVRAPARGPAAMYLALTGGDAEVDESPRTFSRTTLALIAIVTYALATPLFWASAAHAKTHRAAPHATLVSKDHGSDSHDGEHDGSGDGGPDPNAGKGVAAAGNSNTGVSAQSNNPAAPSNTSAANANGNTSAQAACPAQPSNTSAAQANSNSNTAAQANSNTGAQANSNTGANSNSNTGAQANSNTGVHADAKAAHGAKAKAARAHAKAKGVKANAAADSNTGVSAASANSNTGVSAASANSSNSAGAPGDQTSNAQDNCPPPVVPPVIKPPVSPNTPPGVASPTPGSTPVSAAQQPASGVAGVVARSARANLRAQRTCATSAARVTMSVRNVRRVVFSVNGRRVRAVDVAASARTVSVALPLRASGSRRQTVTARVTFRNGQAARTLRARVTRCAAVRPQFTG